jgi:hypothetical protein
LGPFLSRAQSLFSYQASPRATLDPHHCMPSPISRSLPASVGTDRYRCRTPPLAQARVASCPPFFPPLSYDESGPHSLSFLSQLWFKPLGDPPPPPSISAGNLGHKSTPQPPQQSALAFCPPRAAEGHRCSQENTRRHRRLPPIWRACPACCSPLNRPVPHPLPFLHAAGVAPDVSNHRTSRLTDERHHADRFSTPRVNPTIG